MLHNELNISILAQFYLLAQTHINQSLVPSHHENLSDLFIHLSHFCKHNILEMP